MDAYYLPIPSFAYLICIAYNGQSKQEASLSNYLKFMCTTYYFKKVCIILHR